MNLSATQRRERLTALVLTLLGLLLGGLLALTPSVARAEPTDPPGRAIVYFFWGEGCPHCAAAKPVLAQLQSRHPGMIVRDYEIYNSAENRALFASLAATQGFQPSGVPTLLLGDRHWVGFAADRTGPELEQAVTACLATGCADAGAGLVSPPPQPHQPSSQPSAQPTTQSSGGLPPPSTASTNPTASAKPTPDEGGVDLPIIGRVNLAGQSLVVTTLLIALVDGFNPCSLWVLTILLALALRTGSRKLTMMIGLVFIGVTGLVYALFIAGIFSVLTVLSMAPWVRILVALIAGIFAVINIKDYFWFKRGISLTIPDSQKPGITKKMRAIVANTDHIPAMLVGTAALAAGVSFVELACTAGFPVVWTNLVASRQVGAAAFVGLLALYMLVYQLDELIIFGAAVVTLRASKLEEKHGRVLKLIAGVLMLTLAIVMIVDPALMNSLGSSLLVFAIAVAATLLVLLVHRLILPRLGIAIGTREGAPTPVRR